MPSTTRGGGRDSTVALKFREKLVGKGHATDALLKKLKTLSKELADLDQEKVEVSSLNQVKKELINATLLLHKDRGVKAFVACCLADILRLYAPDAPYTPAELRDIFEFFFRQLTTGLTGTDAPYYQEYYNLLESLSSVKTVVLVCDLPASDSLITTVFKDFFTVVKRDLPKKIEMFMGDILAALIDESVTLPSDVLEKYLLQQFKADHARMNKPGFRLAVSVCRAAADKLQRHVCQYFTDIIVEHAENQNYEEISDAHEIIKHINRSCPSLLHNVVPQLEEELRMDDAQLRLLATQVIGDMFGDNGGKDLMRKYNNTWEFWLTRRNDRDVTVRITWVEAAKSLILHNDAARTVIEGHMNEKLFEPDEKVRAAVCKVYSQLDYEAALHYVSVDQLKAIGTRFIDKKASVREHSLACMGKLYSLAYPEIESNDPAAIKQFGWIPEDILLAATLVKPADDATISQYILPLPVVSKEQPQVDEAAWTDRLLTVTRHLTEKAFNALIAITGLKQIRPTPFDKFLQACIDNNGGVIDGNEDEVVGRLDAAIARVAAHVADPHGATEDLNAFAKLNQDRLYKLMKTAFDPLTDLKGLVKATVDFRKRLEQTSSSLLPTMETVLRRGSLHIINQSSIPTLVKRVQRGDPSGDGHGTSQAQQTANQAFTLLTYAAKHCPAVYKPHVSELTKAFGDERNPRLVEICLQALAGAVQWDNSLYPSDERTTQRIQKFVTSDNARHAKFAARLLSYTDADDQLSENAIQTITEALPTAEPELVVAHLTALTQFARFAPNALETKSEDILAFVVRDVLGAPTSADEDVEDAWVADEELWPELEARVVALKFCRNRCLAHADTEGAMAIATPVLRMFTTILVNRGSLTPNAAETDDPRVTARMRLQAGVSLLRLACKKEYAEQVLQTENFVTLALVAQDEQHQIRQRFIAALLKLLAARQLRNWFHAMIFITAHDPEPEIPNMVKSYIQSVSRAASNSMRLEMLEIPFLRLMHTVAHHPDMQDFDAEVPPTHEDVEGEGGEGNPANSKFDTLHNLAGYIRFYVDNIVTANNLSLLYHLAEKLKMVRDSQGEEASKRLYIVSELAQMIIKNKAASKGWPLQRYPGKVSLPGSIFKAPHSPEDQRSVVKRVYLPEETLAWFAEQSKVVNKEKQKAERKARAGTKRKAPAPRTNGRTKRTKRKKKTYDSDDDDDEDDDEESSAEEMDVDNVEASDAEGEPAESDAPEPAATSSPREERLSRGARTRANAKIREQTKPRPKPRGKAKNVTLSSDEE